MDTEKVKKETSKYKKVPVIMDFKDDSGNDNLTEQIQLNYERIKNDVKQIVEDEKGR